ncbi:MAG: hypothetical protein ACPGLV_03230 [Bacteroidia bacterium]
MKTIKLLPLILITLVSACTLDETPDVASLVVGTYKGKASDDFTSSNGKKVIITKISNNEIKITPDGDNLINSAFSVQIVQDGNWVKQSANQQGATFEAKASKNSVPITFSLNAPSSSFEGKREN